MTALAALTRVQALRRAAVRASMAPSVGNSQPWRFVLDPEALEIHGDRHRGLSVPDPTRRQMFISCGGALFNARVALAGAGYQASVQRFPDLTRPDVVVRLSLVEDRVVAEADQSGVAVLDAVLERCGPNRRAFTQDTVPADVVDELIAAAAAAGAQLIPVALSADRQSGSLPSPEPCVLVLCVDQDNPAGWLRAGESLQRTMLEVTRRGYAASIHSHLTEPLSTRVALSPELRSATHPQVLLRVGRAEPQLATRRRRLVDMLTETG